MIMLSSFFSGMEIAFLVSNKLRIELDKTQHRFPSAIIDIFTHNQGQYIATMLVGNNIALVVYGIITAKLLEPVFNTYFSSQWAVLVLQTIVSTFVILITAEFLPKSIFRINANAALKIFAVPVFIFYILFFPVTRFTLWISEFLLRIKIQSAKEKVVFGRLDLDNFVNDIQNETDEQVEIEHDIKIFQNALDFSKIKLRECIIPRTEIVAIDVNKSVEELLQKFIETGYSKILVYEDTIDNIIGYVHLSEMFKNPISIKAKLIRLPIVPETMTANKLLSRFIHEHKSMALVVDEFGGTAGMVTIEDIMEEIFGEIVDEHDVDELIDKQISETEYFLSGRLEIDFINEKYHLNISEAIDYETIAGFILFHHNSFPSVHEIITISNFHFKILKVTSTRIELVQLIVNKIE